MGQKFDTSSSKQANARWSHHKAHFSILWVKSHSHHKAAETREGSGWRRGREPSLACE